MLWILGIAVVVILWAVAAYNGLVGLKVRAQGAWSDIDVQLKRRYELIPNLVSTVKGYASHESQVFSQVTEARSKAMQTQSPQEKGNAEAALSGAMRGLIAIAENYPQLKANENFLSLQQSLAAIEEAIQSARRYYNAVVRDYNTKQSVLPDALIAKIGGFQPREFFQLELAEESKAPKVSF
jgi:LemA protein